METTKTEGEGREHVATALNHALKLLREKAFEKHRHGKHFRKAK